MLTERLYYHDSTLLEFDATVVAHAGAADRVVLDRTAFYPTSGGQPHDTGLLGGRRVVDVLDEGDRIVHVLDGALEEGAVHGRVDADRRRDHMQQHSAQHLLSALAADRFGWETVSVHFGVGHSTIEFAVSGVDAAQLEELEQGANEAVAAALPVTIGFEEAEAAVRRGLRKPPAQGGTLRIITMGSLDRSACGGTHVTTTSEIGPILINGVEKIRGQVRIGFVAGDRVLHRVRIQADQLRRLAERFGCSMEELDDVSAKRLAELREAQAAADTLEDELAALRLTALSRAAPADSQGIRRLLATDADAAPSLLRAMARKAAGGERLLFVACLASPPAIVVGTSADSGLDAGQLLRAGLQAVSGRGGGSARFAQGSASDPAALLSVARGLVGSTSD